MNLKVFASSVVAPVIVALILGGGASYIAIVTTIEKLQVQIVGLEKDLIKFQELGSAVRENQRQLVVLNYKTEDTSRKFIAFDAWRALVETRLRKLEVKAGD